MVPAIFLKYAYDKKWNHNAANRAMLVADVVSIPLGIAEFRYALKAGSVIAVYAIAQSSVNIAVNSTTIGRDPKYAKVVGCYNLIAGLTSAGLLAKGFINTRLAKRYTDELDKVAADAVFAKTSSILTPDQQVAQELLRMRQQLAEEAKKYGHDWTPRTLLPIGQTTRQTVSPRLLAAAGKVRL